MKKILIYVFLIISTVLEAQTTITAYTDADNDGYGTLPSRILPAEEVIVGSGFSNNNLDCDDTNHLINPNTIWYLDKDKDGYGVDNHLTNKRQCANPSSKITYLLISGDLNDTNSCITNVTPKTWYLDGDKDGFGTPTISVSCSNDPSTPTIKYVLNNTDCDDTNASLKPNNIWYLDNDKDGFGTNNTATNKTQCLDPSTTSVKYLLSFGDLDDTKTCVTNIPPTTYYQDLDGDTYGNAKVSQSCSTQPAGYVTNADDADDANPNVTIVKINMTYDNAGNQLNRQFVVPTSVQSKLAATDRIDCLPNPVVDNATVSWQLIGVKTMKSIRLYNDKGVLLQTFLGLEKANTQAINFKNYAAGQYQLLLQYSDSTQKAITITKQ